MEEWLEKIKMPSRQLSHTVFVGNHVKKIKILAYFFPLYYNINQIKRYFSKIVMLYKETCLLEGDLWTADATKAQLQTSPMLRSPTKVGVGVWGVHQNTSLESWLPAQETFVNASFLNWDRRLREDPHMSSAHRPAVTGRTVRATFSQFSKLTGCLSVCDQVTGEGQSLVLS